jgi:hypothetical protein
MVIVTRAPNSLRSDSAPQPVLILCADEGITDELVRDLAARRYQPLVGRPNWSWQATLEWARPAAAVVDRRHPAARSDAFLAAWNDFDVGLVVFGGPSDIALVTGDVPLADAVVPTADIESIGGAVDATVRKRRLRDD